MGERSLRFQLSYFAKGGARAKKHGKGEGEGKRGNLSFSPLLLLPHSSLLLSSQLSRRPYRETLAT